MNAGKMRPIIHLYSLVIKSIKRLDVLYTVPFIRLKVKVCFVFLLFIYADMDDDCYPSVMLAATAFRHQPNNNSNTAHSSSTHLQHSSNTTSITSNTSAQHPQQQPQSQQTHIQTHPPHQIHFPSKGHQATTTTAPPVHPVILVTSTAGSKPTISTTHLTINSSALMSTNSHTANLHHIHQQSSKQVNPVSNSRKPSSQYRHQHNENSSHSSDGDDIDVDDSNVKDEPLSPGSSCPASPTSSYDGDDQPDEVDEDGDLVAFSTAGELVYEHKVSCGELVFHKYVYFTGFKPINKWYFPTFVQ